MIGAGDGGSLQGELSNPLGLCNSWFRRSGAPAAGELAYELKMRVYLPVALLAVALVGCGSSDSTTVAAEPAADSGTGAEAGPDGGLDADASMADEDVLPGEEGGEDAAADQLALEADAAAPVADPAQDGPYTYEESDLLAGVISVHCAVPSDGPTSAPYPLVLFAHGYMIESYRYYDYLKRLGSFGIVACSVGYSSSESQADDPGAIVDVLDWALGNRRGGVGRWRARLTVRRLG